jgi:hypothetical protein
MILTTKHSSQMVGTAHVMPLILHRAVLDITVCFSKFCSEQLTQEGQCS